MHTTILCTAGAPAGPRKDALLASANQLVHTALRLDPREAWTQSALAWVEFANGNYNRAEDLSARAVKLDPNDGNVLDFHGAISLFSGHFEEAIKVSDRKNIRGSNQRFANRNIFAAASFHLGDMQKCVEGFREATQFGDPLSAPSLAYQAAALAVLGRRQEALEKLGDLKRAWPGVRLDEMLHGIYKDRAKIPLNGSAISQCTAPCAEPIAAIA